MPGEARFVARQSILSLIALLIGCLVLTAFGLWIAGLIGSASRPMKWLGLCQAALFVFCGVMIFWRLFDRDEQIRVDGSGIYWKKWSDQTIPWAEIREIQENESRDSRFLGLWLEHPDRFPSTTLLGRVYAINRRLGFGDISLSTTGTDKSFDQLQQAVLGWRLGVKVVDS